MKTEVKQQKGYEACHMKKKKKKNRNKIKDVETAGIRVADWGIYSFWVCIAQQERENQVIMQKDKKSIENRPRKYE